ncbi:Cytochrome c-551 precursor [compost metagenome]
MNIIGAYLAATYGSAQASDADVQAASSPAAPVAKVDAMALLQSNSCLSCHAINHKVVGPAYREVATKYANDPQALAKIMSSIQKGGTGKWGNITMPPFAQLSPDDLQTLATFVLSQ